MRPQKPASRRNLTRRPPNPAKGNGRVQRACRRALWGLEGGDDERNPAIRLRPQAASWGRRPFRNEVTWPNCPHAGAAACEARKMGSARAGMVGLTRSAMTVAVGTSSWSNSTRFGAMGARTAKRRTLRAFLYLVFAVIEPSRTNKPAPPAFAIPLRTSESWRPSVAG